jgi:hypothetical protein
MKFVHKDVEQHILDQDVTKIPIWSDFIGSRQEFLAEGLDQETTARVLDSVRSALRRKANAAESAAIKIELTADGNTLVAGQLIADRVVLEAKLHELMQCTPLDLYVHDPDEVSPEALAAIESLLRKLAFKPIIFVQHHGKDVKAFGGWRFG